VPNPFSFKEKNSAISEREAGCIEILPDTTRLAG
jgi:hypothetical protein